jgi:hypothetical protein
MIDEVRRIVALRNERYPGIAIEAGLSVAFGCTIAGAVSDDETIRYRQIRAHMNRKPPPPVCNPSLRLWKYLAFSSGASKFSTVEKPSSFSFC